MYLALPRDHRLAGEGEAAPVGAAGRGVGADVSSSPCARHVVRCCHAAGFEPSVSFESDDYQTVQGLVAAGVGVALIPELALSVVREDVVDSRALAQPTGAPGDRRHAAGRAAGAGGAGDARRARTARPTSSSKTGRLAG